MLPGFTTFDPAEQRKLVFGAQACRDSDRVFATRFRPGSYRLAPVWRQVEEQDAILAYNIDQDMKQVTGFLDLGTSTL